MTKKGKIIAAIEEKLKGGERPGGNISPPKLPNRMPVRRSNPIGVGFQQTAPNVGIGGTLPTHVEGNFAHNMASQTPIGNLDINNNGKA